mgnify:CR=1 FL=1
MSDPGGMPGNIAVDFEVLARAARDLRDASHDVGVAASLATAHPVDANSFGIVNAPLGMTAQHLAASAAELLALLAASTEALASAADDVVAVWREYEDDTAGSLDRAAIDLEGGRALR